MTRPPRFEIDVEKQFPTLPNAPIVEAVIQFNAPPTKQIEPSELKTTLQNRFEGYEITDLVRMEAGFTGSPSGMEVHQKSTWDGLRLLSPDGKCVCQWKRGGLIVSRLAPYENWCNLHSAFAQFWGCYRELHAPELIDSLGVRFISQIGLKANDKLSDFVQKTPPPLKGLGLRSDSFYHQDTIPVIGYPYEIRLIRAMQRAAEPSSVKSTLIVDIDVAKTEPTVFEELDRSLQEIRFLKNSVFFAFMKDAESKFS